MEYKALNRLSRMADVEPIHAGVSLTRDQRLLRWAEILERVPERSLHTFLRLEYHSRIVRETMRVPNSPISVALEDPVLRAAGMVDDSYGEAKRFFGIQDHQIHAIVCACRNGTTTTAKSAASLIRAAIPGAASLRHRLLRQVLRAFGF